ncbi:sulfurtransferase [Sorangium sp. So ce281]|uniref:sulfurtransferase n=1 Tax=unclassified Sorangium TaxID=2621164 RepID=UPI003F5D962F
MTFANPQALVDTGWLQEHLDDPDLRILDCTVFLTPTSGGVHVESGRAAWAEAHIPGSAFADLLADLSDRGDPSPVMMPPAEQFAAAMSGYGVGDGVRVVLYDASMNMWAARVFWMLRAFGFDRAAVLDGGWRKWTAEGRPVSADAVRHARARFVARPRAGWIVDKSGVLAAMGDTDTCIVNALSAEEHAGEVTRVARPGRIPGSVNVPAGALVDPSSHAYLAPAILRDRFEAAGALGRKRIITYCGGGIAACSDAFVLSLLGAENVAVYDGSLAEWAADPALPLEVG